MRILRAVVAAVIFFALARGGSAPALADGVTFTDAILQQTLTQMGFAPTKLSKGFLLAIKSGTWTINMQVVISPDTTKLGMNANLGSIPDATAVTAAQWMALLISNGDIDPSAFYYDKDQKKLYLHRSLDNHDFTVEYLRKQIDAFAGNVKDTEALWKFTK